jgi:hypothetical protein
LTIKPPVSALLDRFLKPANQAPDNSDPCDHYACGRHQTRPSRAAKDRREPGTLDEIVAKYANGARQAGLATEYGTSLSSIKRILRQAHLTHHTIDGP